MDRRSTRDGSEDRVIIGSRSSIKPWEEREEVNDTSSSSSSSVVQEAVKESFTMASTRSINNLDDNGADLRRFSSGAMSLLNLFTSSSMNDEMSTTCTGLFSMAVIMLELSSMLLNLNMIISDVYTVRLNPEMWQTYNYVVGTINQCFGVLNRSKQKL
jgi:hypothetical protein